MTARLLSASCELVSTGSPFNRHFSNSSVINSRKSGRSSRKLDSDRTGELGENPPVQLAEIDWIRSSLIDSLQQGTIVVCRSLKPVYWNAKAHELCQALTGVELSSQELPPEVSEVCYRLLRDERPIKGSLVMECRTAAGQTLRIAARWLPINANGHSFGNGHNASNGQRAAGSNGPAHSEEFQQAYILVFLENQEEILWEELRIERQKYDLTDREAEIWMLLRQEHSYQEIAQLLQISLNTVKTHVKNVYAKKRGYLGREKFWCED